MTYPPRHESWKICTSLPVGVRLTACASAAHKVTLTEEDVVRGALRNARPRQRSQFSPEAAAERSYWMRTSKNRRTRLKRNSGGASSSDREREQFWCRALLCLSASALTPSVPSSVIVLYLSAILSADRCGKRVSLRLRDTFRFF